MEAIEPIEPCEVRAIETTAGVSARATLDKPFARQPGQRLAHGGRAHGHILRQAQDVQGSSNAERPCAEALAQEPECPLIGITVPAQC